MNSKTIVFLAFALTINSIYGLPSNSWSAYSDSSSFRDALRGKSYEETFGSEAYDDNPFGSSLDSAIAAQYSGSSSTSYASQPKTANTQLTQQRSQSNYGLTAGQRYNSPAVVGRSGQKSSAGITYDGVSQSSQPSYGQAFKGISQTSYDRPSSPPPVSGGYAPTQGYDSDDDHSKWLDVFGRPGQDFPAYNEVPNTGFNCANQQYPGYYADSGAQCQAFYICQSDGRQDGFLCPNATLFNQQTFVCEWWYNVDCSQAANYYRLNADLYKQSGSGYTTGGASGSSGYGSGKTRVRDGYGGGQTRVSDGYGGGQTSIGDGYSSGQTSIGDDYGGQKSENDGYGGQRAVSDSSFATKSSYDDSSRRPTIPPSPARAYSQRIASNSYGTSNRY